MRLVGPVVPHPRVPRNPAVPVVPPLVTPPDDVPELELVLVPREVLMDPVAILAAVDHEVDALMVPVVAVWVRGISPDMVDRVALVAAIPDDSAGGFLRPSGDAVRDQ